MLKTFVILALCIVAIQASGNLHIIDSPKSLQFKGSEKLGSEYVGDVVSACLGFWVDDALIWSGLYINDPFSTANSALVFLVTGTSALPLKGQPKSYPLTGSSSRESMNGLNSEAGSYIFFDFDFLSDVEDKMNDEFGEIQTKVEPLKSTKFLKPDLHLADKEFLTQIALLLEIIEKITASSQPSTLVTFHISLEPIAKTHGEKSPAMAEAMQFVTDIIDKVHQSAKADQLVIAVTEKSEPNRAKRETVDAASAKSLNLAAYYNEDYPVIFNIILWFMVVLGFSLLAICYAIGSMDPGRDSIIYRMTSTRMKKDN